MLDIAIIARTKFRFYGRIKQIVWKPHTVTPHTNIKLNQIAAQKKFIQFVMEFFFVVNQMAHLYKKGIVFIRWWPSQ